MVQSGKEASKDESSRSEILHRVHRQMPEGEDGHPLGLLYHLNARSFPLSCEVDCVYDHGQRVRGI
jgi:hypothetical protein